MTKGLEIPRHDSLCALCRKAEADEVGSHMAPNFIIHKAFAFDGKGKRDHEIAYLEHLNDPSKSSYYGRGVSPEAINADIGHEMTDDEIDSNVNNLVYDNIFCKACERRFGVLETEYSKFYNDGKIINPRVAYIFWLSVFWRMNVGYMALDMNIEDELEIRKILDTNMLTLPEIIRSQADLGTFGYVLFRCRDVQKGDSGIFATRARRIPYIIIVNDLIVALVRDNASKHQIAFKSIKRDYVNSWQDDDIYEHDITLEEFARMKRWILDESFRNGFGPLRERAIRTAKEHCRHTGNAKDWESFELLIIDAEEQDSEEASAGLPLRNVRRFGMAEIKAHAAKRAGRDYNYLQDRSLLLFQFDVDNYRSDLIRYARRGEFISHWPLAKKIVPHKYWKDEASHPDASAPFDYEHIIDDMIGRGYTLEDILDRNCCLKEIDMK